MGARSQSLWNRAVSYDVEGLQNTLPLLCLNPFGTGQCLTTDATGTIRAVAGRLNPFGTGQCLTTNPEQPKNSPFCLNPFGTGQCLTTAVGSSSLVRQGLPKPLPNFFRDSESWVLI